jgi:hypothetical protein
MSTNQQTKTLRQGLSPLWIIALFLSFTESVAGVAATQSAGFMQITLTSFVVVFPMAVSVAFFIILWQRPFVLYPPREFGPDISVQAYADAMRRTPGDERSIRDLVREQIQTTLDSEPVRSRLDALLQEGLEAKKPGAEARMLDYLSSALEAGVKKAFVQVDSRPLLREAGREFDVPYVPDMSVSRLLDEIWFEMRPNVHPFSYTNDWVLKDAASGKLLWSLGRPWARSQGLPEDTRTLAEIGIDPTHRLEVVPPEWPKPRSSLRLAAFAGSSRGSQ